MRSSTAWIIFTICLAIFGVAFIWPLFVIVRKGFWDDANNFTLEFLIGVFKNPIYLEGLFNSFLIALGTTSIVACLSIPLAWLNNKYDYAGKRLLSALLLVPMILPPFVGAIGMSQILGQYGVLNSFFHLGPIDWLGKARYFGVIILQALSLYPIMYLNVSAALANIDPAMGDASENLGCTGFEKFRKITLPLIMPGIFAGGTIVFIWSFTELGAPLMLNYTRCTPVQVWDALKDIASSRFPYALVFVMLSASVLLYIVGKLVFGRTSYAMQSKAATASNTRQAVGLPRFLLPLVFASVAFLALLPHIGVILTAISPSGSWYHSVLPSSLTGEHFSEALGHEMTVQSIRNSLFFSVLAVIFNLILGIAIAFVVVRSTIPVRGVLDTLSMMPLMVPGIVMAFGYLAISTMLANTERVKSSEFLTNLLDVRVNPTLFLVIAYAIRRLPYMVRSAV
ncbi:MAG TPA: iron ABC transporter permease, partial [Tepidisphaeraceae bacterium]|nr:iron ABC transporter permease [Tepidisphaeraceae bacterium]